MSSLITIRQEISVLFQRAIDGTGFSTVLDLDSCGLEFSSLQKCGDVSPGTLRLCSLFLLECSEALNRQSGKKKRRWSDTKLRRRATKYRV